MTPTRSEVKNVIAFIKDSLTAAQLFHAVEPDESDPNVWLFWCYDEDYINSGMIGWDNQQQTVRYYAYDPVRANHSRAEGIEGDEAEWTWETKTAEFFVAHLTGEVREIVTKYQGIERAAEKELDTES